MAIISRTFQGKMNLDTSPFAMPAGDYSDALNITRDAQGQGQDRVVSNINGNQLVPYNLPTGYNKRIGSKEDPLRNRIYYMIWNSYSQHLVMYYDRSTNTIVKLIENLVDSGGVDILGFDPSYHINHIDIIYRDEGDLLLWSVGNTTPKKINVTTILNGTYGVLKQSYIEVAKSPIIYPPTVAYQSDLTRTSNSLKKTMFQFSARYQYDDYEKTTFSTYSKIPLPVGFYGSDNNIDETKNNYINITVPTGDENVIVIEIAMRTNIGDAWSDFVLIESIDKKSLNIPDNSNYQFAFYNDGVYPPIDGVEYISDGSGGFVQVIDLFDWVPQLAGGQVLGNGNILIYGDVTESYNNYPVNQLNVTITAANVTNNPPDTTPPTITWTQVVFTYNFTITGSVPVGTVYKIVAFVNDGHTGVIVISIYTSVGGDTIDTVATGLYNYTLAHYGSYAENVAANVLTLNIPYAGSSITEVSVVPGPSVGSISTEKTWLPSCNYIFGLVYVDNQNRDMPGVTTFTSAVNTDADFSVTTPDFSESSGVWQTPVISATINHLPPAGAVAYHWVRRRQTYASVLFYETCDFQDPGDGYLYFCLANIDQYKVDNSQFIYGTAPITAESRIKIITNISASAYTSDYHGQDYTIVGTVIRTLSGGGSPANDVSFIKVVKPAGAISPAYTTKMLVLIYTPALNPSSAADAVYNEWGETYGIYELNGVMYHRGKNQDQTASQAATFTFDEGDVYYHDRTMYNELLVSTPYVTDTVSIMDENFSDFFNSAVNDNGRAQVVEVNAQQTRYPVLYRFGGAYQTETSINQLNHFQFGDFDQGDRSRGAIKKMFMDKRYMWLFQQFDVGVVPIYIQIVTDVQGNPLEANSDQLLNKITYPYQGQFGIGDVPESFAFGKNAKYGVDSNKGIVWRISQDGQVALSVVYDCNAFFVPLIANYQNTLNNGNPPNGGVYTGNPTCYGVFDSYTNKYIIALEEINRYNSQGYLTFHQDPYTVAFLETRNTTEGFESKYSYYPEGMTSLNNLLVAFKNGQLWTHDSQVYCNFFGQQFSAYIEGVFNDSVLEKKTWEAVEEIATDIWECPSIYSNVMSYGNQKQQTNLVPEDFNLYEQYPNASILRDINSIGGINDGDYMKGGYLVIRFQKTNASNLVILSGVSVLVKDSPLTAR
jgi:hypothetical protein